MPLSASDFGAPKVDRVVISDEVGEWWAKHANNAADELVQVSHTKSKLWVRFTTSAVVAPLSIIPDDGDAVWGDGTADMPTVVKTGTGLYTVTALATALTPGSWTSAITGKTEAVAFRIARGWIDGFDAAGLGGDVRIGRAGHILYVQVYSSLGALSDLGGAIPIVVEAG